MIPPPKVEQIYSMPPVARVTITYSAAKALKEYLDIAIPRAEQARRTGSDIHDTAQG